MEKMTKKMNDIEKYIDASSILAEARMMQFDCHETYILVEGESDKTFFTTLMGSLSNIRFRPVNGWERVHTTIMQAQQEGYTNILGIIDRDYHYLINDGVVEHSQLLFTDSNDIEMMLFDSIAFDKFLDVCANRNKLKAHADPREPLLNAACCIGALRAISLKYNYCFHFDGFECKHYVDRNTLAPDYTQLIKIITQRTRSNGTPITITDEDLKDQLQDFCKTYSSHDLCNGHDILDILSIAMAKQFATASSNQYNPESLFNYLLLGYTFEEFQKTELYKKLIGWIQVNTV